MDKVNEMEEINGKATFKWELLYEYGGFFVDAGLLVMDLKLLI